MSGQGGITDEAAIEGHDLIHNAEVEEQRAHGDQAMTTPDDEGIAKPSRSTGDTYGSAQPSDKYGASGNTYGSGQQQPGDMSTSTGDTYGSTQTGDTSTSADTGTSGQKQTQTQGRGHGHSTMEKVKEALHMKK